jgi:hypothetical protein
VQLYAERGPLRPWQIAGDLVVVGILYVGTAAALALRDALAALGDVGVQLDRSGRTVTQGADRAGEAIGGIPAIGGALAAPFGTIAGAGTQLSAAGDQVADSVGTLGLLLPALLLGLAFGYVLFGYLPRRIRWIREAAEVRSLLREPHAARLLAHRAVTTRPLRTLRRTGGNDVAEAFSAGRWEHLAAIELTALGLDERRVPPAPASDPG